VLPAHLDTVDRGTVLPRLAVAGDRPGAEADGCVDPAAGRHAGDAAVERVLPEHDPDPQRQPASRLAPGAVTRRRGAAPTPRRGVPAGVRSGRGRDVQRPPLARPGARPGATGVARGALDRYPVER